MPRLELVWKSPVKVLMPADPQRDPVVVGAIGHGAIVYALLAPTRRARRFLNAQAEGSGAPGSPETSETSFELHFGCRAADRDRASRTAAWPARSRVRVKICHAHGGKFFGPSSVVGFRFIQLIGQGGAWSRVFDNAIPFRMSAQFREETWQRAKQFIAFRCGKRTNRLFNLVGGAHPGAN